MNNFNNPWLEAQIRLMSMAQLQPRPLVDGGGNGMNLAGHAPQGKSGNVSGRINDWMKQQDSNKLGGKVSDDQMSALKSGSGPLSKTNTEDRSTSINLGIMQPSSYLQNAAENPLQGMSSSSALNMGGLSPNTYSRWNMGNDHPSWG